MGMTTLGDLALAYRRAVRTIRDGRKRSLRFECFRYPANPAEQQRSIDTAT
jgi:hypothetical protein